MSRTPISRENSSNNLTLNPDVTPPPQQQDAKANEQAANPPVPQLTQKTEANQPQPSGDAGFSKADWKKHGQGSDEQSAQKQDHPKEKSSQGDEQKSSSKQADAAPKGKAASSTRKVNVPSLKLGGSGTATLKNRPPVSTSTSNPLGSHRVMSPRTGDTTQPKSSSSSSTPNANTQGQASSSAQSARSLPPVPQTPSSQTPPVSTSNAPASARGATSVASNDKGMPASLLSYRSYLILDAALINGHIDPTELGNLLVEVQTSGFTSPTSIFSQGKPFLRAGLQVLNFISSDGRTHDSVNLIEKFLQPLAEKVFNTPECNGLRRTILKNYLPIASSVEGAARGMRPKEMQQSEQIKNLMDPVIKPFTTWVCGENENLTSSQLPEAWKSLLLGIDDAVCYWAKNTDCTNMKEIKNLRSEAMIAFISTRGYMMAWGTSVQQYCNEHSIASEKFNSFLNSYFAHRANKFITDIMLTRKDLVNDSFDSKMRGYIGVLSGRKVHVSAAPTTNVSGRRQLTKTRTMQSMKTPPANTSNTVNDENATLSPRMREKIDIEKNRDVKQKQSEYQRKKIVSDFSKLANLAKISPEFFRAFQSHVEKMSAKAYEKFEQDPVKLCIQFLDNFYVGVLNKEKQATKESVLSALEAITPEDIKALAPAAEKVKSYVRPESEFSGKAKEISFERKKQFLGNFIFYINIDNIAVDFIDSFKNHILNLSTAEYLKFEAAPIASCRAYVEKLYSDLITTSSKADRNRLDYEKKQLVDCLKNTPPDSIKGLKDSIAAASKPTSDAVAEMASPRSISGLELPAKPIEENEKQATTALVSTASIQPLQSSLTPSSSTAAVKLVQENEISAERRNDFLDKFYELANINRISIDFDDAFKKHILGLSPSDYLKFLESPIANCRALLNQFYDLPFHKETKQSRQIAREDKTTFFYRLYQAEDKKLEEINKLAAASAAPISTASIQPLQNSRTPPVASVGVKPVAEDVESLKAESSSSESTEIVSDSDTDVDDAASQSEKTEES